MVAFHLIFYFISDTYIVYMMSNHHFSSVSRYLNSLYLIALYLLFINKHSYIPTETPAKFLENLNMLSSSNIYLFSPLRMLFSLYSKYSHFLLHVFDFTSTVVYDVLSIPRFMNFVQFLRSSIFFFPLTFSLCLGGKS